MTDDEMDAFEAKQAARARVSANLSIVFAVATLVLFVGAMIAVGVAKYSECRDFGHSTIYCIGGR